MEMKLASECWLDAQHAIESIDHNRICTFGIPVIDDALTGILPNDLILIGADSGVGKSEIALDIAMHNASMGRKVAMYFLEGGCNEAINRIRWKMIKNRYFKKGCSGVDLDYAKWRMNKLDHPIIKQLNQECLEEFVEKVKDNLHIYSFDDGFTIDMLMNSIGYFSKQVRGEFLIENRYDLDLLIIDHLQYFSLTSSENQFTEMTQILMKVKEITNHHNIPVVLISHLRKREKGKGLPGQDDFYGTSNACKISSQSIVVASHNSDDDYVNGLYPTFFRFVKSRTGIRPGLAALCKFDAKAGKYLSNYELYKLIEDKPMSKPLEKFKLPKWAYDAVLRKEREDAK